MKFALLGLDDDTLALCQAILDSREHELVAICAERQNENDPRWPAAELEGDNPSRAAAVARLEDVPLSALAATADTIIVSRAKPGGTRLEEARFLARQGVALVVSHPMSTSSLDFYELEMIGEEMQRPLLPLVANQTTPQVRDLIDRVRRGGVTGESAKAPYDIGPLEQIVMHRRLTDRSRASVLEHFARDAILLGQLCGEVKSVAAMGPEVTDARYTNLNVQMAAADGRLAHWSVEPIEGEAKSQLTLIGSRRTLTLDMTDYEHRSEWKLTGADGEMTLPAEDDLSLANLVDRELHSTPTQPDGKFKSTLPTWRDATRGMELTEAAVSSLKKGRTIKLRAEGRGEEDAFKGTMAALGCAILIGAMFLLFGLAAAMFVARSSGIEWLQRVSTLVRYWPHALLVVLVAFLLIQLLRFLIPSGDSGDGQKRQSGDGG